MQVVINVHERDIQSLKNGTVTYALIDAMLNGKTLPKGHGRLVDADKLKEEIKLWDNDYTEDGYVHVIEESDIDDAPTIIEPDRE